MSWHYASALSPWDVQSGSWASSPSFIPPHHDLETTLDDDRDYSRPVYVRPPLFRSVGPIETGSLRCRLGVGAFFLKPDRH